MIAAAALAGGCGVGDSREASASYEVVGRIIDVRDDAIGRIDAFTILTTDGKRLRIHLVPGLDYGFGAVGLAHLEEHSISGEPIRAAVRRRDGKLVALTVDDA